VKRAALPPLHSNHSVRSCNITKDGIFNAGGRLSTNLVKLSCTTYLLTVGSYLSVYTYTYRLLSIFQHQHHNLSSSFINMVSLRTTLVLWSMRRI
jgi:hypothetical protein